MIVVITIHGIGFQQAPSSLAASDGYADALHESLRRHLEDLLGDDPTRIAAGGRGPVYAQSNYPPLTHATEPGLRRLGSWTAAGSVDITGVPLAEPGKQVAHVALVYSGLESQQSDLAALHDLAVLAKPSLDSYATLGGLGHMLVADLEALREHPAVPGAPGPSLQPRTEAVHHRGIVDRLLHRPDDPQPTAPAGGAPSGGSTGVLRTVEDDVAAYVTSNEHRERVRMFLRDAVSRILTRPDVEGAVINGHGNGTVMGFDLISAISPPSAPAVRALITAGSPLRKYSDLLQWGDDAGNLRLITGGGRTSGIRSTRSPTRSARPQPGSAGRPSPRAVGRACSWCTIPTPEPRRACRSTTSRSTTCGTAPEAGCAPTTTGTTTPSARRPPRSYPARCGRRRAGSPLPHRDHPLTVTPRVRAGADASGGGATRPPCPSRR